MFLLLFVFVVRLSTCHAVDVEYREKVLSGRKGDWFGVSLATSYHMLVIGARSGSVMVDEGVRVKGPDGGDDFGEHVDVNQQFMVVSGHEPLSFFVYVYQSYSPYNMVARFPSTGYVWSLVISDDNTIAVSQYDNNYDGWLTIYHYDGSYTWNVVKKFKLERFGNSLSVYGDILVVGVHYDHYGHVHIFNRVRGEWAKVQTIIQDDVQDFGCSVTTWGQHMAVSSCGEDNMVFTYMLDQHTNTWVGNGNHSSIICLNSK